MKKNANLKRRLRLRLRWEHIRLAAASVVLGLFLFSAFSGGIPAQLTARILSKLQLVPSLIRAAPVAADAAAAAASGTGIALAAAFATGVAVSILIIVSALFLGRVYCSLLCPFGLCQDIIIEAGRLKNSKSRYKFKYLKSSPGIRYAILALCIILPLAGIMIPLILLEPYSLWGRLTQDIIKPVTVFFNRLFFVAMGRFGVYVSIIEYSFNLPVFLVTFFSITTVSLLTLRKGRFYCSHICPAGIFLGLFTVIIHPWAKAVTIDEQLCTSCGLCEKVCRTGCIDSASKRVDFERCVMCGNCFSVCPGGGIRFTGKKSDTDTGRRTFLKKAGLFTSTVFSAAILPSWLMPVKRAYTPDKDKNTPSTPPGSKGTKHFTSRCISCHQCVSVCPAFVLQPSLFEYGFKGILQPVMDYKAGYCEFECTECGKACPAGAILPFTLEQKKRIQIGRVYFEKERCVVVTNGTICGACAEGCPTHAVGMEPYGDSLDIPVTDNALCVGCGACENICPVAEKAIYVKGLEVHGTAEVREPLYKGLIEAVPEEFPF